MKQRYNLRDQGDQFKAELVAFALEFGLNTKESTLRSIPENLHWHLKRSGTIGTLEVTWMVGTGKTWISIHGNRDAPWIAGMIEEMLRRFG